MSKGQDSKKNVKKQPLLTAKEKKAAKKSKKAKTWLLETSSETGYQITMGACHLFPLSELELAVPTT